ncbi:hypothetical protein KI387_044605 [Taxus chinensis]|uniref:Cytochrome P450 n=1 Tax=Taxus chinensis TaxID=29808 RepID=A0AA38CNQ3_TAXCH|nr:hypothetical protein KI387_044605 [Taxus chinensis]
MAFSRLIEAAAAAEAPTIVIVLLLSFIFYLRRRNSSSSITRLPPGPFQWPVIGNLHQFGRLPHLSIQHLANKYGPIMWLRLGYYPVVVVSTTEMAKEFLKTHDLAFSSRPKSGVGEHLVYNYKSMGFSPYGDYWRHIRRVWMTELMTPKRLSSFRSIREEEVCSLMRSIWEKSEQGRVAVNVSKAIDWISSSIVWRTVAGKKCSEDRDGKDLCDMVKRLMLTVKEVNGREIIPCIGWFDLQGVTRRMKETHRIFDGVAQNIIDQHINGRKREQSSDVKDIVDVLLEMADTGAINIQLDSIKAIIFDVLTGGIETATSSLEWTMTEMVRNPDIARKLQQEIESVVGKHRTVTESDLPNIEYLQCVVKESLRLHPPAPLIFPRESTEACTVGAKRYVIPPKTRLMINVWAIGRDPAVWEDPLTFKPERFMGKDMDIKGRSDFRMLPFGGGRRGCPGAQMAIGNMELILAQLMHCFDWRAEGDPSELDMSEALETSLSRKHNLFAVPTLKLLNCI